MRKKAQANDRKLSGSFDAFSPIFEDWKPFYLNLEALSEAK